MKNPQRRGICDSTIFLRQCIFCHRHQAQAWGRSSRTCHTCIVGGAVVPPKYVPRVSERVQIIGRSAVFLVVGVDEEQQVADLFPLHFATYIEEGVPFSHLEPYRENLPLYQAELPNIERHDTRNHLHHRTLPRLAILATLLSLTCWPELQVRTT